MNRIKFRSGRRSVYALVVLFAISGHGYAQETTPDAAHIGSLLWQMEQGYSTATLLSTDVQMDINGLVARVAVRQQFRNESAEWVEGIYVFPLPDKAAVDRMRLHIGDRFIEGEIQEKERARKTYEQAKQAGKKTSLVEQQRANLFTTSVANVAPGELVVVEIEYLEDVRYEDGRFSIRFPMTLTPRYISGQGLPDKVGNGWSGDTDRVPDASLITPPMVPTSSGHKITLTADVNAGTPLEIVASRYHPVSVTEDGGQYRVALSGDKVPMDHDFELVWQPVPSAEPRAMAFTEVVDGQPYHLLMVMPPDQQERAGVTNASRNNPGRRYLRFHAWRFHGTGKTCCAVGAERSASNGSFQPDRIQFVRRRALFVERCRDNRQRQQSAEFRATTRCQWRHRNALGIVNGFAGQTAG